MLASEPLECVAPSSRPACPMEIVERVEVSDSRRDEARRREFLFRVAARLGSEMTPLVGYAFHAFPFRSTRSREKS